MTRLVLLRHGESTANAGDFFAGHLDAPLTDAGRAEARAAAADLAGWRPDVIHCSPLSRAVDTATIVRDVLAPRVRVERRHVLIERHYGALQGISRDEARRRHGDEAVARWRRSPAGVPPGGESLQLLQQRLRPYWTHVLAPLLADGRSVLVVTHGNALRMLLTHVGELSVEAATAVDIPTARPLRQPGWAGAT